MQTNALIEHVQNASHLTSSQKQQMTSWINDGLTPAQLQILRRTLTDELRQREAKLADATEQLTTKIDVARAESETSHSESGLLTIGDPIPNGGIDPTEVFATPVPPSNRKRPEDPDGPPPPRPGRLATLEDGFNEEDLRILEEVGDYRFGSALMRMSIEEIQIAEHPDTEFDEHHFLQKLRNSISLERDEKLRIIAAIPKLKQHQIDDLLNILQEEFDKFSRLSPRHLKQLRGKERQHAIAWQQILESFQRQSVGDKADQDMAPAPDCSTDCAA